MILIRYMLKEFFKFVLGIVLLCVFVFVLFDFIHKTTNYFTRYRPQTSQIIQFYLYQIPALAVQVLPIASLLASVITMVMLSRGNEIAAMRAAGMGPLRIGLPIGLGGIILSALSFLGSEYVVPFTAARMHFIEQVLIEGSSEMEVADGARWLRDDRSLIHFESYDTLTKTLNGVRIVELGQGFRPLRFTEVKSARYLAVDRTWMLEEAKVFNLTPSGLVAGIEDIPSIAMDLPLKPERLRKERRDTSELKISELRAAIRQGESAGQDVARYKVDMHIKLAYPLAAFVVCLIGLKFAYRFERSAETARGVLLAFAVGISYWFILNACRALGKQGTIPPFIAAWAANIVVGSLGALMIWNAKRSA